MLRYISAVSAAAILVLITAGAPADAQRGSGQQASGQCEQSSAARRNRSIAGGVVGGLAGRALGRAGVPAASLGVPVGSLLGEAIMSLLDCREQEQAATATNEAVRGGVGTTASWTSETRPGVSGSSSATGEERLADGTHCLTVTDIVIVDGEETRAPKRMCRAPGASGYARV